MHYYFASLPLPHKCRYGGDMLPTKASHCYKCHVWGSVAQ